MEEFATHSAAETEALGRQLALRLDRGDLVALEGQLGAGKTVLVRGLAEGLGLADGRDVSSPTYVLVQEYVGRGPIFHIDLYRLAEPKGQLADLGLEEMLQSGVVLIEWASKAEDDLPRPFWRIQIELTGKTSRKIVWERVS
jgi:tRNA threonylcarbamoyladenosine biosynthesis protein TsaE